MPLLSSLLLHLPQGPPLLPSKANYSRARREEDKQSNVPFYQVSFAMKKKRAKIRNLNPISPLDAKGREK